jgi:hypothetical protein
MTSANALSAAITNLTTAVALIPSTAPVTGADPGLTAAQANAAAAAINAQTAILQSDVASTPPASVPAAPTGFTAVTAGGGSISLSFLPVPGATSYLVESATSAGAEVGPGTSIPAPAATTPPTPVTFTLTGLTVGTTYFLEVFAVNGTGTSVNSLEVSVQA